MSKFRDAIDEHVYGQTADEETGSPSKGNGWYGLYRAPFKPQPGELRKGDETRLLEVSAGAIVYEDTNGFVEVTYYDDQNQMAEMWASVLGAHKKQVGPDEDGGDYTTNDYERFFQYGRRVVTVAKGEDWRRAVQTHMNIEQFWSHVWHISDHREWKLLSLKK